MMLSKDSVLKKILTSKRVRISLRKSRKNLNLNSGKSKKTHSAKKRRKCRVLLQDTNVKSFCNSWTDGKMTKQFSVSAKS